MSEKSKKRLLSSLTIAGACLFICLFVWFASQGYFSNPEAVRAVLAKAGAAGPLLFVLLNIMQAFVPIIPLGATSAVGIVLFGPVWGFILNYISAVGASVFAFFLARHFGQSFILHFVSAKKYERWMHILNYKNRFPWIFGLMMFLPVSPDDLLCMIAGLSNMKFWQFLLLVMAGKPVSIFVYSNGLFWLFHQIETLFFHH